MNLKYRAERPNQTASSIGSPQAGSVPELGDGMNSSLRTHDDIATIKGSPFVGDLAQPPVVNPFRASSKAGANGTSSGGRMRLVSKNETGESPTAELEGAIRRTVDHYLHSQHTDGYWCAELESNVTITSEYTMLLTLIDRLDVLKARRVAKYLIQQQNVNGSWGLFHGHDGDLSSTVEAYFALKLVGEQPDSEPMTRARRYILERGGVECARVFTKIWLALFGQYRWDDIPSMPVELILLPSGCYFNIYEFSSWARGTIVPLSVVLSIRPTHPLPSSKTIPELYCTCPSSANKRFPSYTHKLFYLFDRIAKALERHPIPILHERAMKAAEEWIFDHQEESGDWAGIQPPMVYSILALFYRGYPLDHPVIVQGLKAIDDFCIEDEIGLRMQSCVSPVWDTALTTLALRCADVPAEHPSLTRAASWIVKKQVLSGGDWQIKAKCEPGGWAFEFFNTCYPDVDDTAIIISTLHTMNGHSPGPYDFSRTRAMNWCIGMQSRSGGWGAFDKDNNMVILNRIPFADNEALVDYPTADVTGRVIEAMATFGYSRSHPVAAKAIRFLMDNQEPDGSWWGRWGVNYIYGTWSVLRGLIAMGDKPQDPHIRRAVDWLKRQQNSDGGWGETCETYSRPELRGKGPSTASQTAWAIMGLLLGGEGSCPEAARGIDFLLRNQQPDGTWHEDHFTGTGFPKHFYIRYHNYRNCFPLMALGQYRAQVARS